MSKYLLNIYLVNWPIKWLRQKEFSCKAGDQVQSLGWEDPLENRMNTPVFLPGESHGQRSLAGYST